MRPGALYPKKKRKTIKENRLEGFQAAGCMPGGRDPEPAAYGKGMVKRMAEKQSFEDAMARLEQIVSLLENGGCTLDESLKLFEEGTRLTAVCTKTLKEAEQKIVKLTAVEQAEGIQETGTAETQDAEEGRDDS